MLSTLSSDYANIIQLHPTSSEDVVKSLRILISDIRKSLPKGKEHFLKDRTEEQLIEHFAKGNLPFGAVKEDKLVSCALMSDLSDPHLREFNAMSGLREFRAYETGPAGAIRVRDLGDQVIIVMVACMGKNGIQRRFHESAPRMVGMDTHSVNGPISLLKIFFAEKSMPV